MNILPIASLFIIAGSLLEPILPPIPDPTGTIFTVDDQALPWALPDDMPDPSEGFDLDVPEVDIESMDKIEHTDDYETKLTNLEATSDKITVPMGLLTTAVDEVMAETDFPDLENEDFDTGFEVDGDSKSLYEIADAFGYSLGAGFLWARTTINLPSVASSQTVFAIIFLNIAWVMTIRFVVAAIAFIDMVTSFLAKVSEVLNIITGPLT